MKTVFINSPKTSLLIILFFLPGLTLAQDENLLEDRNGDGELRVTAFGDSITRGVGDGQSVGFDVEEVNPFIPAGQEAGYPLRLEEFLGISVQNSGIPGEVLAEEGVGRVANELQNQSIDTAIISGGANDVIFGISTEDIRRSFQTLINVAKNSGTQPVLLTVTPTCCDRDGRNSTISSYNNAIRSLGAQNGIPVIDTFQGFQNSCFIGTCRLLNRPEGLHPNRLGYDLLGELIAGRFLGVDGLSRDGHSELAGALGLDPDELVLEAPSASSN